MPEAPREPRSLLPLPHLEYQILVSLADADLHGYAIVKEVGARNHDTSTPSTGSLYLAIARLLDNGLIAEVAEIAGQTGGRKRRVYRLSSFGRAVTGAETERLGKLSRLAAERLRGTEPATSSPRSRN